MTEAADPRIVAWGNFYVIVGSSGAALIGVQFVVITLIAAVRRRASAGTIAAFATPTVVHLGMTLLVSALMSAPWPSLAPASLALAACGGAGLLYGILVVHRARTQTGYKPVWEDWFFYAILPLGAYGVLMVAGGLLPASAHVCLFGVAAATLTLLLVGIHNAWDAVTHLVVTLGDDAGS